MITAKQVAEESRAKAEAKVKTDVDGRPEWTEFGARLAALRNDYGVSQRQAASAMGVHHNTLYKVESGLHAPNSLMIVKLVVFYETTFEHLMGPLVEAVKEGRNP